MSVLFLSFWPQLAVSTKPRGALSCVKPSMSKGTPPKGVTGGNWPNTGRMRVFGKDAGHSPAECMLGTAPAGRFGASRSAKAQVARRKHRQRATKSHALGGRLANTFPRARTRRLIGQTRRTTPKRAIFPMNAAPQTHTARARKGSPFGRGPHCRSRGPLGPGRNPKRYASGTVSTMAPRYMRSLAMNWWHSR